MIVVVSEMIEPVGKKVLYLDLWRLFCMWVLVIVLSFCRNIVIVSGVLVLLI